MNEDVPTSQPAPPALPAADDSAPQSARCPHCEAVLRNLRAEPGQSLRCLNCGKRFVPLPAAASAVDIGAAAAEAVALQSPARLPRDVKTPGYWLLRIPAILVCIGSTLVAGIIFVSFVEQSLRWRLRFEECVFVTYALLIPLAGWGLMWIAHSLARMDAGMASWLERRKPGASTLPPVGGASLPYILPLAVGGGLLPVVSFSTIDNMDESIATALIGAAVFYLAFALEDLRQFVWRQTQFHDRLFSPSANPPVPRTPSTLACALLYIAFAIVANLLLNSNDRYAPIVLAVLACLGGAVFTLGRLDQGLARISEAWQSPRSPAPREVFVLATPVFWIGAVLGGLLFGSICLAAHVNQTQSYPGHTKLLFRALYTMLLLGPATGIVFFLYRYRIRAHCNHVPIFTERAAKFTMLWVLLGTAFMAYAWLSSSPFGWEFYREFTMAALILPALACVVLWAGEFLLRLTHWRMSIEQETGPYAELRDLPPLQYRFIAWAFIVHSVQALFMAIIMAKEFRYSSDFSFFFAYPLLLGLCHYPALWLLLLLREFWRIQAALTNASQPAGE